MVIDGLRFDDLWEKLNQPTFSSKSTAALVRFLEKRLGARFLYDSRAIPDRSADLFDLYAIASQLSKSNVIADYRPVSGLPDEPKLFSWSAQIAGSDHAEFASGASKDDDRAAFTATLAEALERYLWKHRTDHLAPRCLASIENMGSIGPYLSPLRFAGFSQDQRKANKRLRIDASNIFSWVKGYSWTSKQHVWIPTQVVSGNALLHEEAHKRDEPLIVSNSTNGLATAQSQRAALLAGALELVERDAYMITWLNQLTLPRFDLNDLALRSGSLSHLLATCTRYQLEVHVIRLITDAPSFAVCAAVLDKTDGAPRVTLGLRADRNQTRAAEKAILEALRIRPFARHMIGSPPKDWRSGTKAQEVGHMDRILYWAADNRAEKLSFLWEGQVQRFSEEWETDSEEEHLGRILAWTKKMEYECTSVSLTKSKANPTSWHVEMVVIPELQPIHLTERLPHVGGARLHDIPIQFGYMPRREPYLEAPHPFV